MKVFMFVICEGWLDYMGVLVVVIGIGFVSVVGIEGCGCGVCWEGGMVVELWSWSFLMWEIGCYGLLVEFEMCVCDEILLVDVSFLSCEDG